MDANQTERDQRQMEIEAQMIESVRRNDLFSTLLILDKYPFTMECVDEYANTPLLLACLRGYDRIVANLLRNGADHKRINIFGKYLMTNLIRENDRITKWEVDIVVDSAII